MREQCSRNRDRVGCASQTKTINVYQDCKQGCCGQEQHTHAGGSSPSVGTFVPKFLSFFFFVFVDLQTERKYVLIVQSMNERKKSAIKARISLHNFT
jgi:hypothetical protein